jgi:DNA-directed RNA polymerase subunit RPC12/RpoP
MSLSVKCKDCGKRFLIKDEDEYILSYCEGCDRLVVLYKINPAIVVKKNGDKALFISSNEKSDCRRCGERMTIRNNNDYYSTRCVNCGFGIIYRMSTHRGVARFIDGNEFNKDKYWTSGKRKADREKKSK